ncbi:MAG: ornithine carbamoyltransferase [Candidatus Omnitrophica bacterium]|nr:ornithine carbamoyltransferase [Candidatus Omnitrophota bacterium]
MKKDLVTVKDLTVEDVEELFSLTDGLKSDPASYRGHLDGKTLALLFQKPSNRTRVSFEVGMYQLGGKAVYLSPGEINLGVRESVKDVARTLSRYVDGIVIRTFSHGNVEELAAYSDKPVINGLSDFSHPCQALADLYTMREKLGETAGKTLAYIGDGNNVCTSLMYACALMKVAIRIATPAGFEPETAVVEEVRQSGGAVSVGNDVRRAVNGAEAVYTDVWASMGREAEAGQRRKAFSAFQVNAPLLAQAAEGALVMHCLPAHRGEEITEEVIEGPQSVVFDQAENRMHVQKAVLLKLMR